jgi:hypothetical protein
MVPTNSSTALATQRHHQQQRCAGRVNKKFKYVISSPVLSASLTTNRGERLITVSLGVEGGACGCCGVEEVDEETGVVETGGWVTVSFVHLVCCSSDKGSVGECDIAPPFVA